MKNNLCKVSSSRGQQEQEAPVDRWLRWTVCFVELCQLMSMKLNKPCNISPAAQAGRILAQNAKRIYSICTSFAKHIDVEQRNNPLALIAALLWPHWHTYAHLHKLLNVARDWDHDTSWNRRLLDKYEHGFKSDILCICVCVCVYTHAATPHKWFMDISIKEILLFIYLAYLLQFYCLVNSNS